MTEQKALLLVLSAAVMLPHGTSAQLASTLETGALRTTASASPIPTANVLTVAPRFGYRSPLLSLSAQGAAWLDGQVWQLAEGQLHATLVTPTRHSLRAEVMGNAHRAFDARSLGTDQMDIQTRVHVIKPHGGFWVGAGTARPWRVAVVSAVDIANVGLWGQRGGTKVTSTFTRYNFTKASIRTLRGTETTCGSQLLDLTKPETLFAADGCRERSRFSDLETSAIWEFLGVEYTGEFGYRFGNAVDVSSDSRRWGKATMSMGLAPRVALVIGGGRQPANPARAIPAQMFGTMGMVFSYLPSHGGILVAPPPKAVVKAFDIHSVSVGVQKITIRIGGVETVDVIGDFSDWEPRALVRKGADLWELQIPMTTGAHHINIRVDGGAWSVPPGLTPIKDGFGGAVGLLIVDR